MILATQLLQIFGVTALATQGTLLCPAGRPGVVAAKVGLARTVNVHCTLLSEW